MKLYRQEQYRYFVLEHKGYFFRFGYKIRRWQFARFIYRSDSTDCFSLWLFGLFLQLDYRV